MKFIKVGITDHAPFPYEVEKEALGPGSEIIFLGSKIEKDFDPKILSGLDALLVWRAEITSYTVQYLERCRIVVRYGVGYDGIDISSLNERNIPFCNVPDYGTEEVADTTCAMLLGLQRKVGYYDASCRHFKGDWQSQSHPTLRLSGTSLGIIGVGRIGTAVFNRMKPFGIHLMGYDPYQPSGHEKAIGYERFQFLDNMLSCCDLLSFHCPLKDETKGMINSSLFEKIKENAILVNTARGGLLESLDVLEKALRENVIWAAGLDVLTEEPPIEHALIKAWQNHDAWLEGRLWINPHQAFYSTQSWHEMRYKAAETIKLYFEHGLLRNRVME